MRSYRLKKGLDIPITGALASSDKTEVFGSEVAILGSDFQGMKPSLLVKEGDSVQAGQVLFQCKKNEGLKFCSRFDGKVVSINRGERRVFQSMVLSVSDHKPEATPKGVSVGSLSADEIRSTLIEKGEWCSIRQRPFDKVAPVGGTPEAIFITATDSNPLAPNPKDIVAGDKESFEAGLIALAKLSGGKTFLCAKEDLGVKIPADVEPAYFNGPHPSGCAGTHIHFLYPVNTERVVWYVGYQDVTAIGHVLLTGALKKTKVIGVCGPRADKPALIEVYRGSEIKETITRTQNNDDVRTISGSVLLGHTCDGAFNYLGHFHNQVTVIEEDDNREFLGWQSPGLNKFSNKSIYLSRLIPGKLFALGSSTNGSKRAMVPIGMFEDVMPLDILPTQLLRALASNDLESAQELGCLELGEEDLSLCTFVSPGKVDFGKLLRENLDDIEKELS